MFLKCELGLANYFLYLLLVVKRSHIPAQDTVLYTLYDIKYLNTAVEAGGLADQVS